MRCALLIAVTGRARATTGKLVSKKRGECRERMACVCTIGRSLVEFSEMNIKRVFVLISQINWHQLPPPVGSRHQDSVSLAFLMNPRTTLLSKIVFGITCVAVFSAHAHSDATLGRRCTCQQCQSSSWMDIEEATGVPAQIGNPGTRDAWIQRFAASTPAGATVIDVSAGSKPYKQYWSHTHYYTHEFSGNTEIVDIFRAETKASKKDHDFGGDITKTSAPSEEFDVVVLTEVLEHVPEPLEAIREMTRLAKSGKGPNRPP